MYFACILENWKKNFPMLVSSAPNSNSEPRIKFVKKRGVEIMKGCGSVVLWRGTNAHIMQCTDRQNRSFLFNLFLCVKGLYKLSLILFQKLCRRLFPIYLY